MSPFHSEEISGKGAIMNDGTPLSKTEQIRRLNDTFRQTFVGGRVLVTAGARELWSRCGHSTNSLTTGM
jgi:hypothetical protein